VSWRSKARHLVGEEPEGARRQELLERLAARLEDPEGSGIDLDLLRDGKRDAWPVR
jgi:hypothetical protein